MIQLTSTTETLLTLSEAAVILGCGRSTAYRYAKHGYGGHRLKVVMVGRKKRTTLAAINEFINAGVSSEATDCDIDLHGVFDEGKSPKKGAA